MIWAVLAAAVAVAGPGRASSEDGPPGLPAPVPAGIEEGAAALARVGRALADPDAGESLKFCLEWLPPGNAARRAPYHPSLFKYYAMRLLCRGDAWSCLEDRRRDPNILEFCDEVIFPELVVGIGRGRVEPESCARALSFMDHVELPAGRASDVCGAFIRAIAGREPQFCDRHARDGADHLLRCRELVDFARADRDCGTWRETDRSFCESIRGLYAAARAGDAGPCGGDGLCLAGLREPSFCGSIESFIAGGAQRQACAMFAQDRGRRAHARLAEAVARARADLAGLRGAGRGAQVLDWLGRADSYLAAVSAWSLRRAPPAYVPSGEMNEKLPGHSKEHLGQ